MKKILNYLLFNKYKKQVDEKNIILISKTKGKIEVRLEDINIIFVNTKSVENVFLMGLKDISNYTLKIGDSVLLTNQSEPKENGIYEVNKGYWKKINLPENKYNIILITSGYFLNKKYLIKGNKNFIDDINSIFINFLPNYINKLLNDININIIDLRNNKNAKNICEKR